LPALFTVTIFVGSALLFLVQPMVARLVLPLMGGTPAVWNTCMVFFQALLLAGYGYAHAAPARLGVRRQALVHLLLLALPFVVLPISPSTALGAPDVAHPVVWLLGVLLLTVGLPFFVVAAGGPLLQEWFAATDHPSATDPYFLYAASNSGSMLALLAYPLLLEPTLPLAAQGRLWLGGYILLVLLMAGCALWLQFVPGPKAPPIPVTDASARLPLARRLRWLLLAFVPSSLLLSVTTYLTTDVAAIPLLWVLPLALYLLTFILAFARRGLLPLDLLLRWMPLVVLVLVLVLLSEATEPIGVLLGLHLLGLFWVSLACHGLLARDRPPVRHLTEFYLWLSAGGVLGGLFNAVLAPLLFRGIAEYPLVLVLACLLRPAAAEEAAGALKGAGQIPTSPKRKRGEPSPSLALRACQQRRARRLDVVLPLALGGLTAALVVGWQAYGLEPGPLSVAAMFALPLVLCYTFLERPVRFGLGVGALLLAGGLYHGVHGSSQLRVRSFFGVHRVTLDQTGKYRMLVHGNTVHGQQSLDPTRSREPLTYYHRTGPIGKLIALLQGDERLQRVAVIGLGAGALACYPEKGVHWDFYEIDSAVVYLACDSGLFTFWSQCPAELELILGDARLTLQARSAEQERYGLLVVDAFSSDAIPVHLLTREALAVYRNQLTDDGLIAFNISNRYLDLEPVLANLARDAGLVCLSQQDTRLTDAERAQGKAPSHWVVLGGRAALAKVIGKKGWGETDRRDGGPVWTDDFSNLLGVFKWSGGPGD
jgi:hypothetical protein